MTVSLQQTEIKACFSKNSDKLDYVELGDMSGEYFQVFSDNPFQLKELAIIQTINVVTKAGDQNGWKNISKVFECTMKQAYMLFPTNEYKIHIKSENGAFFAYIKEEKNCIEKAQ